MTDPATPPAHLDCCLNCGHEAVYHSSSGCSVSCCHCREWNGPTRTLPLDAEAERAIDELVAKRAAGLRETPMAVIASMEFQPVDRARLAALESALAPLLAGRPATPESVREAVGHAALGCRVLAKMLKLGATGFGARIASLEALQRAGNATGALDCTQALADLAALEVEASNWLSADAAGKDGT